MAGIAVAQTTRRQVEHADEHRHEHVGVVASARGLVDGLHDARRTVLVGREGTEHGVYHAHHHRRRHTLAAHVADAEEELLVADEVVVEVAAHLACRHQRTIDTHVVVLQEVVGQHALLYLAGHEQLSGDTILLCIGLAQTLEVARGAPHDESKQDQTSYHQRQETPAYPGQLEKHILVVQCADQDPVRIAAHGMVVHVMLVAVLIFEDEVAALVLVCKHALTDGPHQRTIFASQQMAFACHEKTLVALVEFPLLHDFVEPLQGDVGIHHSSKATLFVVYGYAIGGDELLGSHEVHIRFAPMGFVLGGRNTIILVLRMVVVSTQLHGHYRVLSPAHGIGLVMLALIRIVVGDKKDAATPKRGVVCHHSLGYVEHPFGLVQPLGHHP